MLLLFAVLLGLRLTPVLSGKSNNRENPESALLSPTSIGTGLSAIVHSGPSNVIPREAEGVDSVRNLYRDCLLSRFSSNYDLNN